LLVLGGAAVAMNRRRHEHGEEWIDDEPIDHQTVAADETTSGIDHESAVYDQEPAMIAPPVSAFAWGDGEQATVAPTDEPVIEQDDREPGETWIQRAYRGPSALNPSVSLKTRLKRAAFFDKRDREAAAGLAEPVDPTAGLPDRMVEEDQQEREAELA
jgi:hypothetical protein